MPSFFQLFIRFFTSIFTTIIITLTSYFIFDLTFFISLLTGLLGGGIVSYLLKWVLEIRFLRNKGLSRREYKYIRENLKEAREKINRLQKALLLTRNLISIKENVELIRLANKIYNITKKDPKRFYKAEQFYFHNLDSIVELSEKYALLNSQPLKNPELTISLKETRTMIHNLGKSLENDLLHLLENDLDDLQFELDVAKKHTNNKPIDHHNRRH